MVALGAGPPVGALDDVDLADREVTATQATKDGDWTARLDATNTGGDELALDVEEVAGQADCAIAESPTTIGPGLRQTVTITIPDACLDDARIPELELRGTDRGEAATLDVATGRRAGSVDYSDLRWYLVGAGGALLVVAVVALSRVRLPEWIPDDPTEHDAVIADLQRWDPSLARAARRLVPGSVAWRPAQQGWWRRWRHPLPQLETGWSINDSWATSVGLAAALFTSVLGATDALDDIFAVTGVEVAVVSALITGALVGASPLVLAICQRPGSDGRRRHTVVGVLLAMFGVLTANLGQIAVLVALLLDTTASEWVVYVAAGLAVLVLIVYATRSARGTLEDALSPLPEPPAPVLPPPDAAVILGQALFETAGLDLNADVPAGIYPVTAYAGTTPTAPAAPRRAALI
jgi:hypothetical protein